MLFLALSRMGVLVFVCIPFLDVVRRSFLNAMGTEFAGMENYKNVLTNQAFWQAARNTLRFMAVCVPLLLALSLLCALGLRACKAGRLRECLKTTFLFPLAVPVASVVLLWRLFFDRGGFWNEILKLLGASPVDWLHSGAAFGVLVFTYLWKNMGYDMILWLAGLADIPHEQYEAARIDGAGRRQCFFFVTLPQLSASVLVITVLSVINCFKVFREAYLIAGDYPHESIYMLQHLFNNWFAVLDIQKMAAGAVLLALLLMGLLWPLWQKSRGAFGGVSKKGRGRKRRQGWEEN